MYKSIIENNYGELFEYEKKYDELVKTKTDAESKKFIFDMFFNEMIDRLSVFFDIEKLKHGITEYSPDILIEYLKEHESEELSFECMLEVIDIKTDRLKSVIFDKSLPVRRLYLAVRYVRSNIVKAIDSDLEWHIEDQLIGMVDELIKRVKREIRQYKELIDSMSMNYEIEIDLLNKEVDSIKKSEHNIILEQLEAGISIPALSSYY